MKKALIILTALTLFGTGIHADTGPVTKAPAAEFPIPDLKTQDVNIFDGEDTVIAVVTGHVADVRRFDNPDTFPAVRIIDDTGESKWFSMETDDPRLLNDAEDSRKNHLKFKFAYLSAVHRNGDTGNFQNSRLVYEVISIPQRE